MLEATVSLGILSLIFVGAFALIFGVIDSSRQDETVAKLVNLKRAILGDPRIVTKESRTDFGYLGDMGSLPASLQDLWTAGSQPGFEFNNTLKLGRGWSGPYLDVGPARFFNEILLDAWGNPIQYIVGTGTSAATGQQYSARILSNGSDGTAGTADDLEVEIYVTEMLSKVVGFVRDAGANPLSGVTARLHYSLNGVVTSGVAQTDSTGAYTFNDIPFGNRALVVEPRLIYVAGTGVTTGPAGNNVEFVVQNFGANDVAITSFNAEYDVTAYYEQLVIGGQTVFNNAANRAGSNQAITFSSKTVAGTGSSSASTFPIRIQSPLTQIPDQFLGKSAVKAGPGPGGPGGASGTLRVQMQNFKDVNTGMGNSVDMTGISIRATFSDGSVAIFSPVRR